MSSKKSSRGSILSLVAALLAVGLIGLASMIAVVYMPQSAQLDTKDAVIAEQSQQIDSLNDTIADLNGQITDLQGQLSDLRQQYTANLVTALGAKDLTSNETLALHFYITGTVTNTGVTAAYNAGLHIVGFGSNREVLIDLTSPIGVYTYQNGFSTPAQLSTLYPTQTLSVVIAIYHSGSVVDWDITPVWTNQP